MTTKKENIATRKASQNCIQHFAKLLPELLGGSADLTGSNLTHWKDVKTFTKDTPEGQYIYYGVREFGMSAMMNGMALYGGIIPFGGTFLTFSDYARNALRLASLMQQKVIFVYTHDSIGLGEDGPTHQPIEHISSLRLMPHLSLWRPCDTVESAVAWQAAITYHGPTCLLFSRQNLPYQERSAAVLANIQRGAYVLKEGAQLPLKLVFIATGSEVGLAMQAAEQLETQGVSVRVVSMPSSDTFFKQSAQYQAQVLPAGVKRIAVEAGVSDWWYKVVGSEGRVLGIDAFGVSAPAKQAFEYFNFTVDHLVKMAQEC